MKRIVMILALMVATVTPALAGSKDVSIDRAMDAMTKLAFGRGVLPTADQCPNGPFNEDGSCAVTEIPKRPESVNSLGTDGGDGIVTNPGGENNPGGGAGTGGDSGGSTGGDGNPGNGGGPADNPGQGGGPGEHGQSGEDHGNPNPGGDNEHTNHSGGGDGTNPGGHGNENGTDNPGNKNH